MKKTIGTILGAFVAFTIAATTISAPAQAGKRERRIAAGILLGAAAGAIIAGEVHRKKRKKHYRKYRRAHKPYYRSHRRVYRNRYYAPRVYHRPRLSNWERHVRRCYDRYRSYDHRSDTFIGYDGIERRCRL